MSHPAQKTDVDAFFLTQILAYVELPFFTPSRSGQVKVCFFCTNKESPSANLLGKPKNIVERKGWFSKGAFCRAARVTGVQSNLEIAVFR